MDLTQLLRGQGPKPLPLPLPPLWLQFQFVLFIIMQGQQSMPTLVQPLEGLPAMEEDMPLVDMLLGDTLMEEELPLGDLLTEEESPLGDTLMEEESPRGDMLVTFKYFT